MLDINLIREKTAYVKDGMEKVGADPALIDRIVELDERWRALVSRAEDLKAERNRKSKQVKDADDEERQQLIEYLRGVGTSIDELDEEAADLRGQLDQLMLNVPNVPHEHVPPGAGEEENVVRRTEGELPGFDFDPLPHWEIGPRLNILDFERGVRMSGSRFYVLMGEGARLQRALISWMLDLHVREHNYTEVYPPAVVQAKCLVGTGNLPKFEENLYHDAEEDLWMIPTAEVPLTNLHREEILDGEDLPLYYTAHTPCFRREKMKAGKDVRGIKRGHQFEKVELMKYVVPEESDRELESLMNDAEDVCRGLNLPYRVAEMCTGDLSFVAARKFDLEVWAAGCGEWLEVSSCSNMRSFQARRAEVRYRPEPQASPQYVHTLNGSGLALPRVLIAVLENYQQPDGSVVVPEVLRPYMGGCERLAGRKVESK